MSTEQSELAIQTWELCLPLCQMARARIDGGYLVHGTAAEKTRFEELLVGSASDLA